MEYSRWAPIYERIRADFGYDLAREETAARRLEELLGPNDRRDPLDRVAARLSGREVIVVGRAPGAGPPPIWKLPASEHRVAVVAADGATATCLEAGIVPDVITTDLDGPVASEVTANQRGSLVVVHAHGDNRRALDTWVPEFSGELAGSWAGPPRPGLLNVGGFTDGDRGAYLAAHVRADRVLLWGFDFERVREADLRHEERKRAKLRWAELALTELAQEGRAPIVRWRRDGSWEPYPSASATESTR